MRNRIAVASGVVLTFLAIACAPPEGVSQGQEADSTEPSAGAPRQREIDVLVEETLVRPTITAEAGFAATLLVPPGDLYDPLGMRPRDGAMWIVDDGSRAGQRGGRIWSVDYEGVVSTLVETARLLPAVGFDIAPPTFGDFAGELFVLTEPRVGPIGINENHLIQHLDVNGSEEAMPLCTLPPNGTMGGGIAGTGLAAGFGPPGSPFGDRLFAITLGNSTVYQATADGACTPFVTFDGPWFTPNVLDFSADGSKMLVTVRSAPGIGGGGGSVDGAVVTVAPDGTIDSEPIVVVEGQGVLSLAVAPPTFGSSAGQLFFTARAPAGASGGGGSNVYRLAPDGEVHLVASGFGSPYGMAFADDALWVTDIARDYVGAGYHLPDGFVVTIRPGT